MPITKRHGDIFIILIFSFQFQHRCITLYFRSFSRHKTAPSIHWRSQAVRHRSYRHCTVFCAKLLYGSLYSQWCYCIRYSPYPFIHKIRAVLAETLKKWGQFLLNTHTTFVSLQGMDSMRPTQPVNYSRLFQSKICPGSFNFSLYEKPDSYTAKSFGCSSQTA